MTLVLASGSPRRLTLLRNGGVDPVVVPADVDETPRRDEGPVALVRRLATTKATAATAPVALGADTVVALGSQVLGKPVDDDDAGRMLRTLSGRVLTVWSGVAVVGATGPATRVVGTLLRFRELSDRDVATYVATGEPRGVAGAFRIQGRGAALVAARSGCWTNVVGLPTCQAAVLLRAAGIALAADDCDTGTQAPAAS